MTSTDLFDDVYFALHDPLFTEAESRGEVGAMLELLGLPVGARVLDAACGWGRHASLLQGAGCVAIGADRSTSLLRRARSGEATVPVTAADMRNLPFVNGTFDAVVNVGSLGLLLEDVEEASVLAEARRVLRPRGGFLLECMHRDDVVAQYAARDAWTLPDGTEVSVRRRFDPVTGISRERLVWRRGDESGEKRHALRLRSATEIDGLLRQACFEDIEYFGDWDGRRLRHDSPRLIAVAKAP